MEDEEDDEEEDLDQRRRPVFGADYVFEEEGEDDDDAPWPYADEVDDEDDEETEGRLDFGSISSTVNEKISSGFSSVGTSVTSGVDVSGPYTLWRMGNKESNKIVVLGRAPGHANTQCL